MSFLSKLLTAALFASFSVSCAIPAVAQERRETPEFRAYAAVQQADEAGVAALIAEFRRAWAAEDAAALMAIHAQDTEWINAYARLIRGRDALGVFLETRLFPAFAPGVSAREVANMTTLSIRYIGDDAAVVHLFTDGDRGASRVEGETHRRTHMHFVLERRSADWLIVHTAVMDAR